MPTFDSNTLFLTVPMKFWNMDDGFSTKFPHFPHVEGGKRICMILLMFLWIKCG